MRICLVSSVNLSNWHDSERAPAILALPLGLLSLAAVLERCGHQVLFADLNYALSNGEISLDEGFYEVAASRIVALSPQLVGFSTMCNSYHIALRLAEAVKSRLPEVPILLGGPQASMVDVETLEAFPFVDMVLRGEAEKTLPMLVADISGGRIPSPIPGLTYRVNSRVVRNPDAPLLDDLDSLPMPAYHLFPYRMGPVLPIDTGRGCPFSCSFCSTSKFWRGRFRLKSVDRVIEEIRMLENTYDPIRFAFLHDMFTVDQQWLQAFCERLQAEKMRIAWSCSARLDCVSPTLLRIMAEAGCRAVIYGVETGSARMQREIHKNLKLEQMWAVIDATLNAKMSATVSFIAGFPTETKEDLRQTVKEIQVLLRHPEVDVQLHILTPQIGTLDYERYADRLRFDGCYSDFAGAAYRFQEVDWFRQYPDLFASFYYFRTDAVPREVLLGLDFFVYGPCSAMRHTILSLLRTDHDLWDLYCDWHDWADHRGFGGDPTKSLSIDQFLLGFYEYVSTLAAGGRVNVDLGRARDEILIFYLCHYGQVSVQFVSPSLTQSPVQIMQNVLKYDERDALFSKLRDYPYFRESMKKDWRGTLKEMRMNSARAVRDGTTREEEEMQSEPNARQEDLTAEPRSLGLEHIKTSSVVSFEVR